MKFALLLIDKALERFELIQTKKWIEFLSHHPSLRCIDQKLSQISVRHEITGGRLQVEVLPGKPGRGTPYQVLRDLWQQRPRSVDRKDAGRNAKA